MFEMDFPEKDFTQLALSQEDKKFLAIVGKGIRHCDDGHYKMPLPLRVLFPDIPNNSDVAVCHLSQQKEDLKLIRHSRMTTLCS